MLQRCFPSLGGGDGAGNSFVVLIIEWVIMYNLLSILKYQKNLKLQFLFHFQFEFNLMIGGRF